SLPSCPRPTRPPRPPRPCRRPPEEAPMPPAAPTADAPTMGELLDLPPQVFQGDFVLKLAEGVTRPDQTLRHYLPTPQPADRPPPAGALLRPGPHVHPLRHRRPHQQGGLPPRQFRRRQVPLHGRAAPPARKPPRRPGDAGARPRPAQAPLGGGPQVPPRPLPP